MLETLMRTTTSPRSAARSYSELLAALAAAAFAAGPDASDLERLGGDPDRLMVLQRLARQLGKSQADQIADFEVLLRAERHRQTIATARRLARLLALWLRVLRNI